MRLFTLAHRTRMITGSTSTLRIIPSNLLRWFLAFTTFLTNMHWLVLNWRLGWDSANLHSLSMQLFVFWYSSCPAVRFPEFLAPFPQFKRDYQEGPPSPFVLWPGNSFQTISWGNHRDHIIHSLSHNDQCEERTLVDKAF